jgi:hypothetical protein
VSWLTDQTMMRRKSRELDSSVGGFLSKFADADNLLSSSPYKSTASAVRTSFDAAMAPVHSEAFGDFLHGFRKGSEALYKYTGTQFAVDNSFKPAGAALGGGLVAGAEALDTVYHEAVAQPISAFNLNNGEVFDQASLRPFFSAGTWKRNYADAEHITPGQSLVSEGIAGAIGKFALAFAPDNVRARELNRQPYLRPDFDITDPEQRKAVFHDNVGGKIASGTFDAASRTLLDPAIVGGKAARGIKIAHDVRTGARVTGENVDKALVHSRTERFADKVIDEQAKGGAVAARLHDMPALRKATFGPYLAQALSRTQSREEIKHVLAISYGDTAAYNRLAETNEELAGYLALQRMESDNLAKIADMADPEAYALGFDIEAAAERRLAIDMSNRSLQDKLNQDMRVQSLVGTFQGERTLDYGVRDRLGEAFGRHDFYQNHLGTPIRLFRPVVQMTPHRLVDTNRATSAKQVERWLRKSRLTIEDQDALMGDYLAKVDAPSRAQSLETIQERVTAHLLKDSGLSAEQQSKVLDAMKSGTSKARGYLAQSERRYAGNIEYSLVKLPDGGGEFHYPLMVSQTQDVVPLADLDQLHRTIRRYKGNWALTEAWAGADATTSLANAVLDRYYRIWKPAVLLRPAWPMRVIGDEQMRVMAKLESMTHLKYAFGGSHEVKAGRDYRGEVGPNQSLRSYGIGKDREPIDIEFANGAVTESQFLTYMKRQHTQTGFVRTGYEDIFHLRGQIPEEEFNQALVDAAMLHAHDYAVADGDFQRFYDYARAHDGITVDVNTGSSPTRGFAVGTHPDKTESWDDARFTPGIIRNFVKENGDELRKPGRHLGIWRDGDQWYMDITHITKERTTAEEIGRIMDQEAITDVAALGTDSAFIGTGGTGGTKFTDIPALTGTEVFKAEQEYKRQQVLALLGEAETPLDREALHGAYLGVQEQNGIRTAAAFGADIKANRYWQLSGSHGMLKRLLDHDERDSYNQISRIYSGHRSVSFGDKGYEDAWAVAVNQQIGSDKMARLIMAGKSDEWIVQWLKVDPVGMQYRATLPVRGQNPERWVAQVRSLVDSYVPTEDLRKAALKQEAKFTELRAQVGDGDLPVVHGEDVAETLGFGQGWQKWEQITGKAFEFLGGKPTDWLSRHPYFAASFTAKKNQALSAAVKSAEAKGEIISTAQLDHITEMSREYALGEVKKLLYDLAEHSDMSHMLRFMAPFYGAWQETLTRWAGLVYEKPYLLERAHQVWDAPNRAGVVYDRVSQQQVTEPHNARRKDGSKIESRDLVIKLHLPKALTRDLPLVDDVVPLRYLHNLFRGGPDGEGWELSKTGFNVVAQGEPWWAPSGGPPVQIAVNAVLNDRPDWAESPLGRYFLPFGTVDTGNGLKTGLTMSLPAAYKRVFAIHEGEGNTVFANAKLRIYLTEAMKAKEEGRRPPTWEEAGKKADAMYWVWAGATWLAPTGVRPISPIEPLIIEYRALLEADKTKDRTAKDYLSPDAIFLERHGPELFAITGSLTKNNLSAPATLGAYKASKKYEKLIAAVSEKGSPELAGLIIGNDGAGVFNYSVYSYQRHHETYSDSGVLQRDPYKPKEKFDEREATRGWVEYRKINDLVQNALIARGLRSIQQKEASDLRLLKAIKVKALGDENPQWRVDYNQVDIGVMSRRLENLRLALKADP